MTPRRTLLQRASTVVTLRDAVIAIASLIAAAGAQITTTGSQLRRLVLADSVERVERARDREMLRAMLRVVCSRLVTDPNERLGYGLTCAALEQITGPPVPVLGDALPGDALLALTPATVLGIPAPPDPAPRPSPLVPVRSPPVAALPDQLTPRSLRTRPP